jgi:hypothetical protein
MGTHALQVHEGGAGMPRIVQANLRHVEIAVRCLPQRAQCRRVVRLAGLVAHDVALVVVSLAQGQFLGGVAVPRRGELGQESLRHGEHATRVGRLRLVLVEGGRPRSTASVRRPECAQSGSLKSTAVPHAEPITT